MMTPLPLCSGAVVRPVRTTDADAFARYFNEPAIARYLRDAVPSPYTLADAERWLALRAAASPPETFAIERDGEAIGAFGIHPGSDVYRRSAEIGFWLGIPFWGQGIMTAAVRVLTDHAFATFDFCRLHAEVFSSNPASMRVLEKAGYTFEGLRRAAVLKHGAILDAHLYAMVRDERITPGQP